MSKSVYFEDFEIDLSRTTTGRTITETDIVMHAGQTGDFYPHHMDARSVQDAGFQTADEAECLFLA